MTTYEEAVLRIQEEFSKVKALRDKEEEELEKSHCLIDPAKVMAMGKIANYEDKSKPLRLLMDFERDNSKINIFKNLKDRDVFEVWKGTERWGRYTLDYLNVAKKIIAAWSGGEIEFYVQKEKNCPILISSEEMGFVLAPRITEEEA